MKTTFFTRYDFSTMQLLMLMRPSDIKNQGIIPAESHNIKGTSSIGTVLKPKLNTNHITQIVKSGCNTAQAKPKIEPE